MEESFEDMVEPMAQRLSTAKIVGMPITLTPEEAGRYAKIIRTLAQAADTSSRKARSDWQLAKIILVAMAGVTFWVAMALMFNN